MRRPGSQRIPRPPGSRPGTPAPWAALDPARRRFPLAEVRAALARGPEGRPPDAGGAGHRDAAVLVPLFEAGGDTRVILTKRPETMPAHRGEIAFPGGRHDPRLDRDLRSTALREAEEEIGLGRAAVDVAARLDGLVTVGSQFRITPYVGLLDDRPVIRPDDREVARAFDVPVGELMADGVYREELWDVRGGLAVQFFELDGETVWGATARILTGFLTALTRARLDGPASGDRGAAPAP